MSQQLLESVAVIPDGNRRFAKKKNLPLEAAYLAGFRKAGEFAKWAFDKDVKTVSYWALSLDNFAKRSQDELNVLFKLMTKNINDSLADSRFKKDACRIKFFGKRELLPLSVQQGMTKLEEKTRDGNKTMNIAIAYSGREELLSASKSLAQDIASGKIDANKIDEDSFSQYLYYQQTPQLIIRT